MYIKSTLILLISLFLFSCSTDYPIQAPIIPFEEQAIPVQEKIKLAITPEYLKEIGFPDSTIYFLNDFYSSRGYSPKWINDSTLTFIGNQIKQNLSKPFSFALPSKRIPFLQHQKLHSR